VYEDLFLCAAFSLVKVAYKVNYKLNYNPNKVLILNSICRFLVRSGRGGRRFESSHPDQLPFNQTHFMYWNVGFLLPFSGHTGFRCEEYKY